MHMCRAALLIISLQYPVAPVALLFWDLETFLAFHYTAAGTQVWQHAYKKSSLRQLPTFLSSSYIHMRVCFFPASCLQNSLLFPFSLQLSLCPVCGSFSPQAVIYVSSCCSRYLGGRAVPGEPCQVRWYRLKPWLRDKNVGVWHVSIFMHFL